MDTDVLAIDSDSPNLASATITLTNPQTGDVLTFDGTPPTGITCFGSGTSVITLTGVALSGSYQTALQQIKFSNDSIDPSNVTRTIEVVVSDGTSNSNTATAIVQVEAVNNSAPVIDLDPNDSSASVRTTFRTIFTENGSPIPIADTDTTITDLDSPTLVFATITLANRQAGDLLTVTQPLPGGIIASAYDPGTGVLTLTGTATLDDYEVALQRVLYGSTSEDPGTDDRLIEVLVNDGVNTSNVAAALINVLAVNDAPDILLDTSAAYVENAAVTPLAPLATLTDVDDAEFSEAVIRITDGTIPGDGDILSVDGLTSGTTNGITFLWDAAEHALVFTGASLAENYQDLLRIVGFNSTSDNPTDFGARATRVLTWSVSDGTAVTTTTTTIDILDVNDAPQAAVAATASYTENAAPVVLSPASIASDVDNITLVEGEVRIVSGAVDGDLLTVNGLQSGTFSGIEFSYDPVLRSLTFTHPSLVADYEAFLEAIAFSSTSDDPTNSGLDPTRTLAWFLFDGDAFSDVQTTVLFDHRAGRPAGEHGAGRKERQRGRDAANRRRVGRRRGHCDAHDHADGPERQASRDRRYRRERQRHRHRDHHRHGRGDQHGARRPLLHRQPQLQRIRHADGHHWRRHRAGHRHGRHHGQRGQRSPGARSRRRQFERRGRGGLHDNFHRGRRRRCGRRPRRPGRRRRQFEI